MRPLGPWAATNVAATLAALTPVGRERLSHTESMRMAETTETPLWRENEPGRVESWRLHILLEAGYPVHLAERIAASEVDLHEAVELLTRGCEPGVAAEILL